MRFAGTVVSWIFLALCVSIGVIWIRSYVVIDDLGRDGQTSIHFYSHDGDLITDVVWPFDDAKWGRLDQGWQFGKLKSLRSKSQMVHGSDSYANNTTRWGFLGAWVLVYDERVSVGIYTHRWYLHLPGVYTQSLIVPYWMPFVLCALFPVRWFVSRGRALRKWRVRRGLCLMSGDLGARGAGMT